jgi:hypothetical protein
MGRTDILICPSCDYKRHLTEAESSISYALVVACLKCGTAMQCNSKNNGKPPETQPTFLESCTLEALDDWVVS